jgi:DNA-binding CsgD family transcriptional regulator
VLHVPGYQLVGREAELRRLTELLNQAASGEPVVALISGDAGVGKTRLTAELAARAAAQNFTVLSGRCAELGDSIPYLPLADALRNATTGPAASRPLQAALAARPVLGRLLPDLGGGAADGGEIPELAQQQLFGAVLGLLAETAAQQPVLLILEDMHWADRSSRDLLTFLSRVLHRERVAVAATYRTDDLHRSHPLRPVVGELQRLPSVTPIVLSPLPPEAMAEHLTALAHGGVSATALAGIILRAEGNPYYGEELLDASRHGSDLPAELAGLLLARVERLSGPAQQVLRVAAVAGRRMDDELVRLASGLAGPEYDEAVRESVASQLLVPDGDVGYAFRHALIREAIYADLLPGERTRMHARLAELLSDETRLAVPGTAAELAHHYLVSHDITGAFTASVWAGQEASRLAAPAEAHRHFDQALALWDRVSDPERLVGMPRGWLAFESANETAASGEVRRAVQQLRRLHKYLDPAADPVLACRVGERLAYFLMEIEEMTEAEQAAAGAVDALPPDPPRWERARALATYAQTQMYQGEEESAAAIARQAREVARASKAPGVGADTLVTLGLLEERAGRPKEAVDQITLAVQHAHGGKVLDVLLRATFQLARIHLENGDLHDASRYAHQGMEQAAAAGLAMAPYGLDLQYTHYLAHYADGDWDHAQQLADGFATRVTSPAEARLSAMAMFIEVARGSANVADRVTWMRPFWDQDGFAAYIAQGLLAENALWQNDPELTAVEADRVIEGQRAYSDGDFAPPVIRVAAIALAAQADLATRARAAGDTGRAEQAEEAADRLIEVAREGAAHRRRPLFVLGVEGRAWLARSEAEYLRARGHNDPDAWCEVIEVFGPAFVYETARTRWRLAESLAEAGRRDEAQASWRLAMETARRLGAQPLAAALRDLARRARLDTGQAASEPAEQAGGRVAGGDAGPGLLSGLTAREREVLRLLASGSSNREIAAELFIAPKTASVHVSNILGKLGAASRTEAAAIAHRNGVGLPARS